MLENQTELDDRINRIRSEFELLGPFAAGYPVNQDFDYSELYPLLAFCANNVGDPFAHSLFQSNTHETEREVVRAIADLVRLPSDEAWGYVTTGGTEGQHVRHLRGPRDAARSHRLLLTGHPLFGAQNLARPECAEHHDPQPG